VTRVPTSGEIVHILRRPQDSSQEENIPEDFDTPAVEVSTGLLTVDYRHCVYIPSPC
jgi:hypothetical protein